MSNICESLTLNGKQCRSYKLKGQKFCRVHNENKPTSIVHCLPVISNVSFEFKDQETENCEFRNEYGEYICESKKCNKHFCELHNEIFIKFSKPMRQMVNQLFYSQNQWGTRLSEFIDLFITIVDYMVTNKKHLVNFTMYDVVKVASNKTEHILESLKKRSICVNFNTNYFLFPLYIEKMEKVKQTILLLNIDNQINKARNELISNRIKIQKISEIRIKNSNELLPPISKGVDKIILSFISF